MGVTRSCQGIFGRFGDLAASVIQYVTNYSTYIGRFQQLFICPSILKTTYRLLQQFLYVNRTFLKARFILTLLLAISSNANSQNIILAQAVVELENSNSQSQFLYHLKQAILKVTIKNTTITLDRDKELVKAIKSLSVQVFVAYCCKYLKDNFQKRFKRQLILYFQKVAKVKTVLVYQDALQVLREYSNSSTTAAAYLEAAELETQATALYYSQ